MVVVVVPLMLLLTILLLLLLPLPLPLLVLDCRCCSFFCTRVSTATRSSGADAGSGDGIVLLVPLRFLMKQPIKLQVLVELFVLVCPSETLCCCCSLCSVNLGSSRDGTVAATDFCDRGGGHAAVFVR